MVPQYSSNISGLSPGIDRLTESVCLTDVPAAFCLVGPKTSLSDCKTVISISAGISTSGSVSTSDCNSISGITANLRPPRVRDLRTVFVSERLTSSDRVTPGVGVGLRPPERNPTHYQDLCDLRYAVGADFITSLEPLTKIASQSRLKSVI